MRRSAPGVVLLLLFLLTGCGGGSTTYTLAETRACLREQPGVTLRQKVDFVASTALGGAVLILFPANQVTVSFGLDEEEAARLDRAYRRFKGANIGIDDVLRPKKNAVLLWKAHPSEDDIQTVDGCLK